MALALKLERPGEIKLTDFPYTKPRENAVILKVEMCGICGTDKHSFRGENIQYGNRPLTYPIIPGHEIVGKIHEIGPREQPLIDYDGQILKEGDRVVILPNIGCGKCYYCKHGFPPYFCPNTVDYGNQLNCENPPYLFGGWAEYMYLLPRTTFFKVPEQLPLELAVLTEPFAVAGSSLDKAKEFSNLTTEGFRFGDTVLIQGAGPIGLAHLIKAQMLGAGNTIILDKSDFRLALSKELGADYTFNINNLKINELLSNIRDITGGRGADIVIECTGSPEAFIEGLQFLRAGGMYLVVGIFVSKGLISFDPHKEILAKNARIIGIGGDDPNSYATSMKLMQKWNKFLSINKIVTHRFKLKDVNLAIEKAFDENSCKVVFET